MSMEVIRAPERDHQRTSTFPSLDYTGLYNSLVQLLEILPQLQTGIQSKFKYLRIILFRMLHLFII